MYMIHFKKNIIIIIYKYSKVVYIKLKKNFIV